MLGAKKCPFCAEIIQKKAIICKHCKSDLTQEKESKKNEGPTYSEKVKAAIEEEKAKEKARFEALSPEEKEAYLKEKQARSKNKTRLWITGIFWLLVGPQILTLYNEPNRAYQVLIGFLILFLAIWFQPAKGESFFMNRFKKFKAHKIRMGLSMAAFVLALIPFIPLAMEEITEIKERAEQEFIDNYPEPTIEVLSSEGDQGEAMEYKLKVKAQNTTSVSADSQDMKSDSKSSDTFVLTIPLDTPEKTISIVAKNEHKETKETITITRIETEKEKTERLAQEAKEKEEKILFLESELEKKRLAREAEEEKKKEEERLAQEAQIEKERLAQEEIKFGFTEQQRKQIFREIVQAEDRANKESEVLYPFPDPLLPNYTNELALSLANERMAYVDEVQEIYRAEVYAKYGINKDIAKEITIESLDESWPLPEY